MKTDPPYSRLLIPIGLALLCLSASPGSACGQSLTFEAHGYFKSLAIRSKSFFTQEGFFVDVNRARTKGVFDLGEAWHTEFWLDTEFLVGNFLETPDFDFAQSLKRPTFFDLDWTIEDGNRHLLRQRVFRAFSTFYLHNVQITFGRQRIAWGTGFVWNPTDLLNPFNPVAIELEEKEGVDAAYAAVPLGPLSRAEVAFVPGRGRLKAQAAARLGSNFRGYDVTLMGGRFRQATVFGGDFAGYVGGAGVRGEVAYTWDDRRGNYLRAVLNADYNFPHDIYVFVEAYYNGQGSTRKRDYDFLLLLSGETFSLAKHYVAISLNKNITPLLKTGLYAIVNLDDRSRLLGPALVYSLASNLEVAVSAYLFDGASDSEFGAVQNNYFAFLQLYF